jgi:hypothetical protein
MTRGPTALLCLLAACSPAHAANGEASFAVVELFTSEGCSSCPPADAVLAELTHENESAGRPVYTLSFHVDYWNDLGWRDPYSATWASQRQRAYAAVLRGQGVYTPQLVIDGHDAFVGSHAGQARAGIARSLAIARSSRLQLEAESSSARALVHYRLTASPAVGAVLHVALVEPSAQGQVRAGENAGRVLQHVNIVRAFESLPLTAAEGSVSLPWPNALTTAQRGRLFVVGFVQQRTTLAISAAARTQF